MDLLEKACMLGEAGRWDLCSGPSLTRNVTGDIVHSKTESGCCTLFKTLLSNKCSLDCKYCQNSTHRKQQAVSYEPEELAKVFMHLHTSSGVHGLFISSAIAGDPDDTTQKMLEAVKLVRERYRFKGYVHFKILPGTSRELIRQAAFYADRLSINIEAPSRSRLDELSDIKDFHFDIIRRQRWIREVAPRMGQSTQMVVGAGDETDFEILDMAAWEYETMGLERVYYSGFTPIEGTPLESRVKTPDEREHRLYCVDYMMRKYGLMLEEFKDIMIDGNLPKGDPKMHIALRHFKKPVDLNHADYEDLIRIPGIGPISACRILHLKNNKVEIRRRRQLVDIGVSLKRAEPFIKIDGKSQKRIGEYTPS
ncbi:MAG: radical SAM protein [Candidatus Altiarchaeota archaeon]